MDDTTQINSLYLLLLFFFPGFISLKVYDLLVPNEKRNFSHDFLEAVSYSILNLSLLIFLLAPAFALGWYENIWVFCVLAFLTLLVFPAIWPILIYRLVMQNTFFSKWFVSPMRRPWDWFFSRRQPLWVIVHLKDRRKIGGVFASKSYASSYPIKEQIYLEEVWELNETGQFKEPVETSKGVILLGDDISSIEFFETKSRENDNEKTRT
ncbi:MAG: DUF6338 family protein [Legionellales bacterium]|jgi:hypothetical protein